jgi:RHS repeat-associated protein
MFLASLSSAQTDQTGVPAFSSETGGQWDIVNVGNLNVHLAVPITSRPGRGPKFRYGISFDSTVYTLTGTAPGTGAWLLSFGWTGIGGGTGTPLEIEHSIVGSLLLARSKQVTCTGGGSGFEDHYIAYFDPSRTAHPLTTEVVANTCDGSGGTSGASDSSGYSVTVVGGSGNSELNERATVTSRNGTVMTFPALGVVTSGNTVALTDANGNQITFDGTTITDTLGTTPLTASGNFPNPFTYQFPSPQSGTSTITVSYVNPAPAIQTAFNCPAVPPFLPPLEESIPAGQEPLVDTITLQNGSTYHFTYEPTPGNPSATTGRLASVTLPTGATISYSYPGPNNGINCADGTTMNLTRTTSDGTWTYNRTVSGKLGTTTITDPQGNQTVVTFQGGLETQRQVFQGSTSGALLQTTFTCYNGAKPNCNNTAVSLPMTEVSRFVQLAGGKENEQDIFYDRNTGVVMEVDEYDFGNSQPGALLRKTVYTYASLGNGISDRAASVTICSPGGSDASCGGAGTSGGTRIAQTLFNYDEPNSLMATSGLTQHVAISGSRGNMTSTHRWVNTTNSTVNTVNTFDDAGNVLATTDPGGHKTSFTYGTGSCNGAFVTQTAMPDTHSPNLAHHNASATYDCNTGLRATSIDQQANVTRFSYDNMLRSTEIDYPDGGQTLTSYPDMNRAIVQSKIDGSRSNYSATLIDGYGRVSRKISKSDEATPYDQQDFCYDSNGRLGFKSYPYQGNGFSTPQVCSGAGDTFAYDALGRNTTVTHSDGSAKTTTYTGLAVRVVDEGNGNSTVTRIQQRNALGQMVGVCEVSNATLLGNGGTPASCGLDITGTGFLTSYSYDTLGNLISVNQGALANRVYAYDSLSRMNSETTPEAGTVSYTYDADSLRKTRVRPAPNQTDRTKTFTTTYSYDELHRETGRTYSSSDPVNNPVNTPSRTLNYDEINVWNTPLSNTIGRLSSEWVTSAPGSTTLAAEQIFSYDAMGRPLLNVQCTPNTCNATPFAPYGLAYQYDLLGNVVSASNGVGVTFTNSYNIAGRLTQITSSIADANHPQILFTAAHYSPSTVTDLLGDGVAETVNFSTRGQLQSMQDLLPGGQPATASVTITGGLQMANSSAGVPPPSAAPGSAVTSLLDTNGVQHWAYLGANQHVYHVFWSSNAGYAFQDLTLVSGASLAASGSALTSFQVQRSGQLQWVFLDSNNHVNNIQCNMSSSNCSAGDLTSATGAPAAAAGSALTSLVDSNGGSYSAYLGVNQHLYVAYWVPGVGFGFSDLTSRSSAPAAAAGSALTSYPVSLNSQFQWQFFGTNNHLENIQCNTSSGACSSADLTSATAAPAAAAGSALSSFADSNGNSHWSFLGSNQHVYHAYWIGGTGFGSTDLMTTTPAEVADSGTVSLNVGGLIATACFGPSTNSACRGQQANDSLSAVAAALASALNTSASPATASASGSTINMTWKTPGPLTPPVGALSTTHDNPGLFSSPSFTSAATNFSGGSSSGTPAYSYSLGLAPDGQITSANDLVNGNWAFAYDSFNRLASSNKNSGQATFSYVYDRYGNRWQQNAPQGGPAAQYIFDNNNHFIGSGVIYDAVGNVLTDGLGNSFIWDAEGRLIQVKQGSTVIATYSYDAEGRRVHGPNGEYIYDLNGKMITQIALNGVWSYGEIYTGSRHLATYSGGTTNFYHGDWLGTKRIMTGLNGSTSLTCTGFAFGDGVTCTGTNWTFNGFTDDIHDPETNLEHTLFRQYSGTQGRWLTPDPYGTGSADTSNPQSWNRYAYVLNDPWNKIDPTGLDACDLWGCGGFDFSSYFNSLNNFLNALIDFELAQLGTVAWIGDAPLGSLQNGFLPGEWQPQYHDLGETLRDLLSGLPWNNPCIMSPVSDGCGMNTNGFVYIGSGVPVVPATAASGDSWWKDLWERFKRYRSCKKITDKCLKDTMEKAEKDREAQNKCIAESTDGGAECYCQSASQGACKVGQSGFGKNPDCKKMYEDCMLGALKDGMFPK